MTKGWTKYASWEELVDSKTEKSGPHGCWLWLAGRDKDGYAVAHEQKKQFRVHRRVLEKKLGRPIGRGMFACHHCDTPACVNPEHLYEGTPKENTQDIFRRGRNPRQDGEHNGASKLTVHDVKNMREVLERFDFSHAQVAELFGCSRRLVGLINRRERWASVP